MAAKKTLEFFLRPLLKKFFQDMGRDPNNLEMLLIRQQAGKLLKDSNKIIQFPQKRSFAEEIEAMKKSGDLVDEKDMVISDKITEREMFKNSFLNKNRSSDDLPPPGSRGGPDDIAAPVQSKEETMKNMVEAEIKAKFDKQNKESIQRFKEKMKKDEPEDKADGGRMGFRAGKFVLDKIIANLLKDKNKMKQAADDIFPTGDYKMDAQMAAEALVENNPKIFRNKLYDDLDTRTQIEVYGAVLEPIQKNMALMRQLKKVSRPEKTLESMKKGEGIDMSNPDIADEFARFMKETDPQGSKKIEQTVEITNFDPKGRKKNATGGRAGYYTGGITDVKPSLDDIGHGSDSLMARTRLMSPGSQATTSTGLNYLLAEDNDNIRVPFSEAGVVDPFTAEDIAFKTAMEAFKYYQRHGGKKNFKNYMRMQSQAGKQGGGMENFRAEGGRIGFKEGNGVYDEEKEKKLLRKRVEELMDDGFDFGEAVKEAMKEGYAKGGRIGFKFGGDAGRRAFLKLLAALGGGIAGIKSGLFGMGGKETGKKAITETIKQSAGSGTPPPYFFKLVEKIKTLGDDVTKGNATQERQQITRYKDFELTEDLGTGEKTIQRIKTDTDFQYYDETLAREDYMNYKPGAGQSDEAGRVADEYIEDTGYLRTSGPNKGELYDSMDGLTDDAFEEIMEEVGEVKIKKADGGRIGFRVGGSGKKFLEKIFGKERFKIMAENDPEMHKGMLEVVEMFRNRDKEGLKMYLQKFLPHMDDETIEAFIIGSDGTEGIQGQLIRLGSGRDYAGKIEMMKKADNMRKLENLDVTEEMIRKPNALGGIQTMLGE